MEQAMAKATPTLFLTQADCDAAVPGFRSDGTPKTKLYTLGDGLCLQVTPSKVAADGTYGVSRSWLFRFSLDGKEQRMGLGPIDRLPLNRVRVRALALREQVERKINPLTEAKEQRKERERKWVAGRKTFRACAEEYMAAHEPSWTGEVYKHQWHDTLERFAYLILGDIPVADVDQEMVLRVLAPIWNEKNTTAKTLRARIAAVLGYAASKGKANGYRDPGPNPAAWRDNLEHSLAKPKAAVPHAALDYRQIGAFMAELRKDSGIAARALEFTILTASRTGEVRGARWSEINLAERLWTVPKERMKMRGKQGRDDHIVPLSGRAVAILKAIKGDKIPHPSAYIFAGRTGPQLGESTMRRVCERINPDVAVHGFRSTFDDWASDCTDAAEEIIEFSLAHVKTGVAGRYRRKTAIEKRRALMEAWAGYCDGIAPDNVVPLKRTA